MSKLLKLAPAIAAASLMLVLAASPALAADTAAAGGEDPELLASPGVRQIVTSVITLLVFLGLLVILSKFAWGPIVAGLEKRESKIREDIEAAEQARARADRARLEYEQQLESAEERVRQLIAQAQADGQQVATRTKMQAQEEAEDIKQRAMRDIEQSRREAIEEIRNEAANLATSVAEKILRREVKAADHKRLVEESLDEFQAVGAE